MLNIMLIFTILAGIDKLLGNKYGLGVKFDEGFKAIGALALTIIGLYCLSPVIARITIPILAPLARLLHTDPSVFIASLLASDLGGYSASLEMAEISIVGEFNGVILASMLGTTISFIIPVAVNLISIKDFPYFAKGILAGITTIPLGMLVAGIIMKVPLNNLLFSIIPVVLISIIIMIGLLKAQDTVISIFKILGKSILAICTIGLLLSILDYTLGIQLVKGMKPFEEGVMICVKVGVVLSGAYPLLYFISRRLHKHLRTILDKYDIDQYSILGLISSLANCVPMLGVYEEMNWKGKILNAAFAVSGSFSFGGQLGYISMVSPQNVNAFIMGKLVAGITGLGVALILIKNEEKSREVSFGES